MNKDILIIVDVSFFCRRVNRCMYIYVFMEDYRNGIYFIRV